MAINVALPVGMSEAVLVLVLSRVNVCMKPILFDCLIVLAAVATLVALSFLPPVPWLYLPAVIGVLCLAMQVLRTLNPLARDRDALPSHKPDGDSPERDE